MNAIGPVSTTPSDRPQAPDIKDAARQFEALLIGVLLKSAREETSEDAAGATAMGYAEEHLARALASTGGMGLANMITTSLENSKQPNQAYASDADATGAAVNAAGAVATP